MTEQEIIEGNKLIDEFMGSFHHPTNKKLMIYNPGGNVRTVGDAKYHSSWDWLMPVIEKIESLHNAHYGYYAVHISSNSCSIQGTNLWKALKKPSIDKNRGGYGWVYCSDPNAVLETKILTTWYNAIQFIKWYNNEKTGQA